MNFKKIHNWMNMQSEAKILKNTYKQLYASLIACGCGLVVKDSHLKIHLSQVQCSIEAI